MTTFEEKQYEAYMENGARLLGLAEKYYEDQNLQMAISAYYHASINFEYAKEFSKKLGECTLYIDAKDKEFYCLEKIDELEIFKKENLDEAIR